MPLLHLDDGPLYYEVIDLTPPWVTAPETILFCHGVATNADIWSGWLPGLVDRYRVVRFDTRGFGRSHVPPPGFGWSLDLLADDALAVAQAAGAGQFHFVGESLGGTVGLFMAARGEQALLSVTAVTASHRGGSVRRAGEWRDFIGEHGMAAWSREMMPLRFAPGAVPPDVYDWFERVQAESSPVALLDAADLLIGSDLGPDLPDVALPVLLLAGDSSPFVPVSVTAAIKETIPGSRMQVFPGARHGLACSHGPECATLLRSFLPRR